MAPKRYDFFMLTAELTYLGAGDQPKQRRMNTLLQLNQPLVTYTAINDSRLAILQRFETETAITPDRVKDYVILNISYLGNASQDEFHKIAAPQPKH